MISVTRNFRVLALSASPGRNVKAVQNVIDNLLINHLEIRTETDPDVAQYTHHTNIETVILPMSGGIQKNVIQLNF
jgi:fanconi anemia group M protein